jgi:uncharacterized protein DUF6152
MKSSIREAVQRAVLAAALMSGGAGLAAAHHSYAAFDMTTEKVISGTVVKVNWTNPHCWVWLDVPNEQGAVETWGVEGMSPNYLARRGWSRTTIKPGDKLSVTMHPAKDGSKGGAWVTAKRPSGETLVMGGAITNP